MGAGAVAAAAVGAAWGGGGGGSQGAWRRLLAPGWAAPSPGSLVALSRNHHSESDLAAAAITVEAKDRFLQVVLMFRKVLKSMCRSPTPAIPARVGSFE